MFLGILFMICKPLCSRYLLVVTKPLFTDNLIKIKHLRLVYGFGTGREGDCDCREKDTLFLSKRFLGE